MGATNGVDSTEKPSSRALPNPETLQEAGEFPIKSADGTTIPFKSLFTSAESPPDARHLIIFIRHFFCGMCEEYVRALAAALPPSVLSPAGITLTLVGCGDPVCIPDYKARTTCPYEIYADPSRKIYDKLGMTSNLAGAKKRPEYVTKSTMGVAIASAMNAISRPTQAFKAGPPSQNGGEWLFQNGELKWCHRMENTTGHVEVKELKELLGV